MSDETAKALEDARAEEAERRVEATHAEQEILTYIARSIPARMEEIAKQTALSQPEVAKGLGVDSLKQLRTELAEQAAAVAAELEGAVEQVEWPTSASVTPSSIHSALFNFLYGRRVDSLAAVLKRHGFSVGHDHGRSQGLVLPQSFYRQEDFADLAKVLSELGKASKAAAKAQEAHDRDVVSSLWG